NSNPMSKKSKPKSKLTRNDSINSSLHSNSFYSSVLGSDNSNSQFTSNSYSTGSGKQMQQYGMYQGTNTASKAEQLNRCTSYDPISIGGSSRRSSVASTTSLAAATIASRCTHHSQGQEPKHLNQTDNLVIQPQSLTLANEHFAN